MKPSTTEKENKMPTPHQHAEVLRAIADGKTVQFFTGDEWIDRPESNIAPDPITNVHSEWRIKPESEPDFQMLLYVEKGYVFFDQVSHKDHNHNLKLTFDGETGKLKSVEVL
jgi:hypothetical protein